MVTETVPTNLKWTLSALRERIGMSQSEASKALGISVPTLKKWEDDSSEMQIKDVDKVSKLYHIPKNYIFFGTNFYLIEELKKEETKES